MSFIQFVKNWTLPVAMFTGAVLYLLFAFLPPLEAAGLTMAPFFDAILPLFMSLILFVTFCKVDFRRLIPVPWHFWIGVFQVVFVFIIVALVMGFDMQGRSLIMTEAIITCIIGPCAAAAPVVTAKLGGNLEEMTTYTFISNFITAVLIPICFPLIDKAADMPFWNAFFLILYKVSMVLLLPMLMAFLVKHTLHRFHRWICSINDLSFYLWGCSLMIVTGTTVKNICHADTGAWFVLAIAGLGLVLCIVQFAVGRFIGHYFGAMIEAGQALGQKNTAFAIWIAYTYLNPLSTVGPGCYILWQNIINSIEIWHQRKRGLIKST